MSLEKIQQPNTGLEYKLAGRYVRHFLESRTDGRRAHSWDHTLFVADQSVKILEKYYNINDKEIHEDDRFSVYIASLIHDVIQPNDIRNDDLRNRMIDEWELDTSGGEYSEGVKAFEYIVDELKKKLDENGINSDVQKILIERLIKNRDKIIDIFTKKESEELSESTWSDMSLEAKTLYIADVNGNMNPDMVLKIGLYLSYKNIDKNELDKMSIDKAISIFLKMNKKFNVRPDEDANSKDKFYHSFYNNPKIVNDWMSVSEDTMKNFKKMQGYVSKLEIENEFLKENDILKQICIDEGIGVYGMFAFWFNRAEINPKVTSQEVFEDYAGAFSQQRTIEEITEQYRLSKDDVLKLEKMKESSVELVNDMREWRRNLADAEQSLGIKI